MKEILKVEGMMCGHCASRVCNAVVAVPGVTRCDVPSVENKEVFIEHDGADMAAVKQAIEDAGFEVIG